MVTSIGSVLPGGLAQTSTPVDGKTQRSIAEARRLIAQNHITGATAIRLSTMLTQAQQSSSSGKVVDAQRLAREALKLAQDESGSTGIPAAANEDADAAAQPEENPEETPASQAEGIDPNNPLQRNTTSYVDQSDDPGVSFQYAQPITQGQAPFAVMAHEISHVRRETSAAILNGQRVMASVTIHSRIDPATGERQIGGGQARVIVFPEIKTNPLLGNNLNVTA